MVLFWVWIFFPLYWSPAKFPPTSQLSAQQLLTAAWNLTSTYFLWNKFFWAVGSAIGGHVEETCGGKLNSTSSANISSQAPKIDWCYCDWQRRESMPLPPRECSDCLGPNPCFNCVSVILSLVVAAALIYNYMLCCLLFLTTTSTWGLQFGCYSVV